MVKLLNSTGVCAEHVDLTHFAIGLLADIRKMATNHSDTMDTEKKEEKILFVDELWRLWARTRCLPNWSRWRAWAGRRAWNCSPPRNTRATLTATCALR